MAATLVIMAAGLASRYGGAKQIEKVGPTGEILMEYTIHDAAAAGFDRFVIVLQPGMLSDFREVCGNRLEKKVAVEYAFQSFDSLPDWYTVPEGRSKPFGTIAAVLSGKEIIRDRFAVVNADDYYGPGAYREMIRSLAGLKDKGECCMVAYRLKNTVSDFGTVTRGVCRLSEGKMTAVRETFQIGKAPDGTIRSFHENADGEILDGESPVSMNFWGFTPWAMDQMDDYFNAFLRADTGRELKSECLLPTMVGDMIQAGTLTVKAETTDEVWFGMTYKEDRASTSEMLRQLTELGAYPETLF